MLFAAAAAAAAALAFLFWFFFLLLVILYARLRVQMSALRCSSYRVRQGAECKPNLTGRRWPLGGRGQGQNEDYAQSSVDAHYACLIALAVHWIGRTVQHYQVVRHDLFASGNAWTASTCDNNAVNIIETNGRAARISSPSNERVGISLPVIFVMRCVKGVEAQVSAFDARDEYAFLSNSNRR